MTRGPMKEALARLSRHGADAGVPKGFDEHWDEVSLLACQCAEMALAEGGMEKVPAGGAAGFASFFELGIPAMDGSTIRALLLVPAGERPHPCVVVFHDAGRGVQGWHYLLRFVGAGWQVLAMDARDRMGGLLGGGVTDADVGALTQLYADAIVCARVAAALPTTDGGRVVTWGEGLGGGMALVAASLLPEEVSGCAAANPLPADLGHVGEVSRGGSDGGAGDASDWVSPKAFVDVANFAPRLACDVLVGTGLMDEVAPPSSQFAIVNRATCDVRHVTYPKYGHERINAFEDELLRFFARLERKCARDTDE